MGASNGMWTIGEMSKIAGIEETRVTDYCRPVSWSLKDGQKGRKQGTGLIEECGRKGRTRLYDEDAFLKLLLIDFLRKSDMSLGDIGELLGDGDLDPVAAIDAQVNELEKKQAEIERSLRHARSLKTMLHTLFEADDENGQSDSAFNGFFLYLVMQEIMDALVENPELEHLNSIEASDETLEKVSKTVLLKHSQTAKLIESEADTEEVLEGVQQYEETLTSAYGGHGSEGDPLEECVSLFHEEVSPDDERLQELVRAAYDFAKSAFSTFNPRDFALLSRSLLSGNYLAAMLEIMFGKSFTRLLLDAVDTFVKSEAEKD